MPPKPTAVTADPHFDLSFDFHAVQIPDRAVVHDHHFEAIGKRVEEVEYGASGERAVAEIDELDAIFPFEGHALGAEQVR